MSENNERNFAGVKQLSLRSLILGMLGSCIITASSMYVALRMGALPWPTIFVSVLSMAFLKALGKTTLNEINITQTSMSSGAMVAGGIAFTLPGLWISGVWTDTSITTDRFIKIALISIAGVILGTVLIWFLRPRYIETKALPYPIGIAAADTITAGDEGGKKSVLLFSTLGASAVFTYLRDELSLIKSSFSPKWLYNRNLFLGISISPMMAGIGYIIGTLYTGIWFLGAVIAYLFIIPLGVSLKIFPSVEAAQTFKNTAGLGLMIGTGLGVIISFIIGVVKKYTSKEHKKVQVDTSSYKQLLKSKSIFVILSIAASYILTVICGIGLVPSLLLIIGAFIASSMAATITGQTGVNPMEIFAIIILLAIRVFVKIDIVEAFFIATCIAVACGYAGDLLNDYKTGHILGTNPTAQLISQVAGGLVGALVSSVTMFVVINQFGGIGTNTDLPAPQATAVTQMIKGIGDPKVLGIAAAIGIVLYLLKIPSMTLGIGMYLPFEMAAAVFVGGLINFFVKRFKPKFVDEGNIAASGLFGGEGITGVILAIVKMIVGG